MTIDLEQKSVEAEGRWMSILSYAQFRGISISSIRRYIKAGRVKWKLESGKYFIFVSQEKLFKMQQKASGVYGDSVEALKRELERLKEENNDLRMLVNLYESKLKTANDFKFMSTDAATSGSIN